MCGKDQLEPGHTPIPVLDHSKTYRWILMANASLVPSACQNEFPFWPTEIQNHTKKEILENVILDEPY